MIPNAELRPLQSGRTRCIYVLLEVLLLVVAGCDTELPDAYGNFESDEIAVSAEATGTLLDFGAREGTRLGAGEVVGQIDPVQLQLQRSELEAQLLASEARTREAVATVASLEAQLRTAREDYARTQRLLTQKVATVSEVNRLEGSVASLEAQVVAARARVDLSRHDAATMEARIDQLDDRISRTQVRNPSSGTVLTSFVEAGEHVQQGRPLYTVAPLDTLILRAYLSGGQLARVQVGEPVEVRFDAGDGSLASRSGRVSWVSPVAEFTPTPIQTREERVDQVYAVRVRVPNPDGKMKIGMPGELVLAPEAVGGRP